ncbi:MAG TPA: phosphoribosylanthranilate isomerase [Terracidiphilus sp.]|jgi:phosphoribosylanthranilate isomerase|nr:phosphoribosylanthranilate isomerase [Terracidiphilus sp.]
MSLWVKICGNTSLDDALLAADAGADAVGFVFGPSPRRVTPQQVAAIVPALPAALEKIGVFVDASFEEIGSTIQSAALTGVQLHFNAAPSLSAALRQRFGPALRILRVVHFDTHQRAGSLVSGHDFGRVEIAAGAEGVLAPEEPFTDPNIDAILVDSRTATATGGTGQTFDWSAARSTLFRDVGRKKPLVAAGGLSPENVAEAIATLQPWGVDVVSGIEAAPGRKDPARVRAFIASARFVSSRK